MPRPTPGICMKCGEKKPIGGRCLPCWKKYVESPKVIEQRREAVRRYEQTPKGKVSKQRRIKRAAAKKKQKTQIRRRSTDLRAMRTELMRKCLSEILGCFNTDPRGGRTINPEKLPDLITCLMRAEDLIKTVAKPTLTMIRRLIKLLDDDLPANGDSDKVATYHGRVPHEDDDL